VRNEDHSRPLSAERLDATPVRESSVALLGLQDDDVSSGSLELVPMTAIIPTKGRSKDLRQTVQTMLAGIALPSELIIVDQSPDLLSYDAVHEEFDRARRRQSLLPHLKYVHNPSIRGLSAARNAGMALAHEAIWLFLDDDVIAEPNFVKELMRAYSDPVPVDGVSGIATNYRFPPIAYRAWIRIFARGPFADPRQPIYWNAAVLNGTEKIEVPILTGALMSFRADAIRNLRFDERAGDCQCEDADYCLLLGKSVRLVIAPRARLQHLISPKAREAAHPIRRPAISQAFLFRKHFDARRVDRVRFYWFCAGLAFMAGMAGLRRFSIEPWRTFVSALREGLSAGRASASAANGAAHGVMGSASERPGDESASAGGMNGRTA